MFVIHSFNIQLHFTTKSTQNSKHNLINMCWHRTHKKPALNDKRNPVESGIIASISVNPQYDCWRATPPLVFRRRNRTGSYADALCAAAASRHGVTREIEIAKNAGRD